MKFFRIPAIFLIFSSKSFVSCTLRVPSSVETKAKCQPSDFQKRKIEAALLSDVLTFAFLGSSSTAVSTSPKARSEPVTFPVRDRAGPIYSLARRKRWRRRARGSVAVEDGAKYLARSTVIERTAAVYISAVAAFEFLYPPIPLAGRTCVGAGTLIIASAFTDVCAKMGLVDCLVPVGDKIRHFLQKALVAYSLARGGRRDCIRKGYRHVKPFPSPLPSLSVKSQKPGKNLCSKQQILR